MFGGMGNMLKQAQVMQERMQKAQAEIAEHEVTGEAGGGMVKLVMKGDYTVQKVEIADEVFNDDKEMCEDLILTAINNAVHNVEEYSKTRMASVTKGMQLPPGFKMPF
ncbi:MAG: YbaB/EbfC family nucleoid-associated protein [Succinivibrionaceae bacterium]